MSNPKWLTLEEMKGIRITIEIPKSPGSAMELDGWMSLVLHALSGEQPSEMWRLSGARIIAASEYPSR